MNTDAINLICTAEDLWNTIEIHDWVTDESDIDYVICKLDELRNEFKKYKSKYEHKY